MTTESDRELLEAAARAAGMDFLVWTSGAAPLVPAKHRVNDQPYWHPLSDDGDALRLAVALRLHVSVFADAIGIGTPARGYEESKWTDDPYAATRRAITCAAAAIGAHKEGD